MARIAFLVLLVALVAAACGGGAASPSASPPSVKVAEQAKLGKILVGADGMTLYTFAADTPGQSNCYDVCAQTWPPLVVAGKPTGTGLADPAKLGTVTRKDGTTQAAYDGRPLYFYIEDSRPGEAQGEGINLNGGVWSVVRNP